MKSSALKRTVESIVSGLGKERFFLATPVVSSRPVNSPALVSVAVLDSARASPVRSPLESVIVAVVVAIVVGYMNANISIIFSSLFQNES